MATMSAKRELAFLREESQRQKEVINRAKTEREKAFKQGVSAALFVARAHEKSISFLNCVARELGYESAKAVAEAAGDGVFLAFIQNQEGVESEEEAASRVEEA